jgi:hypothetical protein
MNQTLMPNSESRSRASAVSALKGKDVEAIALLPQSARCSRGLLLSRPHRHPTLCELHL